MQRGLIALGITIVLIGVAWPWLSKLPLGRLPGDIVINRENFRIYIPVTTMVIVSLVISALLYLVRR